MSLSAADAAGCSLARSDPADAVAASRRRSRAGPRVRLIRRRSRHLTSAGGRQRFAAVPADSAAGTSRPTRVADRRLHRFRRQHRRLRLGGRLWRALPSPASIGPTLRVRPQVGRRNATAPRYAPPGQTVSVAAGDGFFSLAGSWTQLEPDQASALVYMHARAPNTSRSAMASTMCLLSWRCPRSAAAAQLAGARGASRPITGSCSADSASSPSRSRRVATTSAGGVHTDAETSPRPGLGATSSSQIAPRVSWTQSRRNPHASVGGDRAHTKFSMVSYAGGDTSANNLGGLAAVYYRF